MQGWGNRSHDHSMVGSTSGFHPTPHFHLITGGVSRGRAAGHMTTPCGGGLPTNHLWSELLMRCGTVNRERSTLAEIIQKGNKSLSPSLQVWSAKHHIHSDTNRHLLSLISTPSGSPIFKVSKQNQLYTSAVHISCTHQLYTSAVHISCTHQLYTSAVHISCTHQLQILASIHTSTVPHNNNKWHV
jgi:hypothetical protein